MGGIVLPLPRGFVGCVHCVHIEGGGFFHLKKGGWIPKLPSANCSHFLR